MKIDRELQLQLLRAAVDAYPGDCIPDTDHLSDEDEVNLAGQIFYLREHGLIETRIQISLDGMIMFAPITATKDGIDFMADDGGLSAVLRVVTVKLHDDTIRDLLIKRVEGSDAEPTVKGELVKQIRALPAEGLRTLTTKVLEAGLHRLPNAIQLLHTWLHHA